MTPPMVVSPSRAPGLHLTSAWCRSSAWSTSSVSLTVIGFFKTSTACSSAGSTLDAARDVAVKTGKFDYLPGRRNKLGLSGRPRPPEWPLNFLASVEP